MQEEERSGDIGRALLFELRGGRQGTAHSLPWTGFRIGSNEDNDLVLKDRDVQPQQLEISFVEDGFVVKNLSDEGSVFLNGEPFEEAALHKGDILTVGESMFRYVEPGETLSQEELWRPVGGKQRAADTKTMPLRRISFLAMLSLVAVVAVLFILFTQGTREDHVQPGTSGKLTDLEKPVDREEIKVEYENGKDLLAARRWDEAILVFEGIRKQMPNFMDVEDLYQEAQWESEAVDLLDQGKGLILENQFAEAKARIERIPKKSVYYREAERLTREIEDRILEQRLQAAHSALARKDWSSAKREAEGILAKYPNNKDARRVVLEARLLQRQVADKGSGVRSAWTPRRPAAPEHVLDTRPPVGSRTDKRSSASLPKRRKPLPSGSRKAGAASYIDKAIARYRQGHSDQSLAFLERASKGKSADRARALAADLQSAVTCFQQASTLQQQGRLTEAVDMWKKFLEKDRSLVGDRGGVYFRRASASLAKIYFDRGRREFERGNPIGAALFWKMGRQIDPKNRDLKRGFVQLDEAARKIYREGYSLQEINIDEAIEKWNEVLMILPPDHAYYRKAKRRIDRYAERP